MRTEIFEVDEENGIAVDDAGRGSRWVTAERFAHARNEWAAHAATLRARLNEVTGRADAANDQLDSFRGLTVDDVAALVQAARFVLGSDCGSTTSPMMPVTTAVAKWDGWERPVLVRPDPASIDGMQKSTRWSFE